MRSARARRRGFIDVRRITIGDYIVLAASALTVISLFLPWFTSSVPSSHGEWAFTYSEVASVVVIVFFLATLFLVVYPAVASEMGLPPLPFSTPLIYLTMGAILLLMFVYELGKYACIECQGVSRGFGIWLALFSACVYIVGAVVRWGSRPTRGSQAAHGYQH
ncbi:MAG TPA: hypothetical protein VF221_02005 [Chloroflexota bacterium]